MEKNGSNDIASRLVDPKHVTDSSSVKDPQVTHADVVDQQP